jgi:hypothetical protein
MPKFSGDDGIYAQFTALVRNAILGPIKDPGEAQPENQTKWAYLEDVVKFGAFASKVRTVTAAGTVTLADADPIFIEIDPNGSDRDVSLPAKGATNHGYLIRHVGSANVLSVKRSGGTVIATTRAGENYYVLPSTISDFSVMEPARETRYKITPTVASNNLTVALKHLDGTDPSTSRPLWFKIADSWRAVTAALSVTINAGAASFALGTEMAAKEIDLFAYVSWRAASSAVVLGFSRLPYGTLYSDFSATANTQNYAPFSTAPASGDDVVNIGRFAATNSGTASYNWSVPTFTTVNLIQSPIAYTRWLTWLPTYTGFTGTVPTGTETYKVVDDIVYIHRDVSTDGTSNATTFTMTFPFAFAVANAIYSWVATTDNGATSSTPGHLQAVSAASNVGSLFKTFYQGVWTNSGAKNVYLLDFTYRLR